MMLSKEASRETKVKLTKYSHPPKEKKMDEPSDVEMIECPVDGCNAKIAKNDLHAQGRHTDDCHPEVVIASLRDEGRIPEVGPSHRSWWLYVDPDSQKPWSTTVLQVIEWRRLSESDPGYVIVAVISSKSKNISPEDPLNNLTVISFWELVATRKLVYLQPHPMVFKTE